MEDIKLKVGEDKVEINSKVFDHVTPESLNKAILRFGDLVARAEELQILVEAEYRAWRAKLGHGLLSKDPKLSEWKIKIQINTTPDYMLYKKGIGVAARNVALLKTVLSGLEACRTIPQ